MTVTWGGNDDSDCLTAKSTWWYMVDSTDSDGYGDGDGDSDGLPSKSTWW